MIRTSFVIIRTHFSKQMSSSALIQSHKADLHHKFVS
jgi:hypothetical protein